MQDLQTSEILYNRDADKSFMPASNMKLMSTSAAFVTMGKDYRFETNIYATGTTDTAGVLHGDIYVVGSGDPSISGRYLDKPTTAILAEWCEAIKGMGIKTVEGNIIGDDDVFDESAICGSWQIDYLQEWYAAENSGLAINENCWDAMIYPAAPEQADSRAALIRARLDQSSSPRTEWARISDPFKTSFYSLIDGVKTVPDADGATSGPKREEAHVSIERDPASNRVLLEGTIEEDSAPEHEWGSIHNGTLFTVTLLDEQLKSQGVLVRGKPVDIDDMDPQLAAHIKSHPGTLVHKHISPPLSKIIALCNKPSQNFYADMLLKDVGAKTYGEGSWRNGEKAVKDMITTAGANAKSLNMADGSGLSRRNMIEPRQILAVLVYLHGRSDFEAFKASLPIMGIDGTLKGRMTGTPAEGNVHAKTGTIGGVRALSGYMTAGNGHKLAFSMIGNNYYVPTREATEAQNQAVLELLKP